MSHDKPLTEVPSVPSVPADAPAEEKRPNIAVRGWRKIKATPTKTVIAVVGGVSLVAAGAFVGRKTAPLHVEVVSDDTEPEPILQLTDSSEDSVA